MTTTARNAAKPIDRLQTSHIGLHLLLLVAGAFVLLPFALMLLASLMPKADILRPLPLPGCVFRAAMRSLCSIWPH